MMRCPTAKQPEPDLPPAIVAGIASILAAGYLKYRRSLRASEADNCLDSSATQSLHPPHDAQRRRAVGTPAMSLVLNETGWRLEAAGFQAAAYDLRPATSKGEN
jgi:hypothetical protein